MFDDTNDITRLLNAPGSVLARLPGGKPSWGLLRNPVETLRASTRDEAAAALPWLEEKLAAGLKVAGFISYEASPVFDKALVVREPSSDDASRIPLIWLAAYDGITSTFDQSLFTAWRPPREIRPLKPEPCVAETDYTDAVRSTLQHITDGDIYQANMTFPLSMDSISEPETLFMTVASRHPVPYLAYVNAGDFQVLSFSPELFLEQTGRTLRTRPMKGTAKRGLCAEADRAAAEWLANDPKNRAENVMIVDMARNDFGRVCRPGTIKVNPLFHVETYATVHQMVSEVRGSLRSGIGLSEILRANFPAPSITGAPKVKAMEIIAELEGRPRGVYTGSVGVFTGIDKLCLNVAIRTIVNTSGGASLHVGAGIVADSDPESEWRECLLKSEFANRELPRFEMLETILWRRGKGFLWLTAHLRRLKSSQLYFGRPWDKSRVMAACEAFIPPPGAEFARARLLLDHLGNARMEAVALRHPGWGSDSIRITVGPRSVDSRNALLYHKTTARGFYNDELCLAKASGYDEVLFINERDEITEGSFTNVFIIDRHGVWRTPPVSSGLLPGIWRASQIRRLKAIESIITIQDLHDARRILVGNSVRGGVDAITPVDLTVA